MAFTFKLEHPDGDNRRPARLTIATPQWREGDTFMSRPGQTFRIPAINDSSDDFHAPSGGPSVSSCGHGPRGAAAF
jgi:hypothetical protein